MFFYVDYDMKTHLISPALFVQRLMHLKHCENMKTVILALLVLLVVSQGEFMRRKHDKPAADLTKIK